MFICVFNSVFMSSAEYVSGRLFIDGVMGTVINKGYFYCHHRSCPFSLKVVLEKVGSENVVVGVESVLFGFHNHEETKKKRVQVEQDMKLALDVASLDPDLPECLAFKASCDEWLQVAKKPHRTKETA